MQMAPQHAAGRPPGGFGSPPPGGFGGPPGGYGGNPGGGGFGQPPGRGGFGGPPPGGGGWGGPPGGFGNPPGYGQPGGHGPRPPKKGGSNVGLIIGIGCVGLVVLALVVGGVASYLIASAPKPPPEPSAVAADDDDGPKSGDDDDGSSSSRASAKIELKGVRFFKKKGSNTVYVVGELHNIGSSVVDSPRAKLTLLDANKNKVGEGTCAASGVHDLTIENKVPCATQISVTGTHKTYRVKLSTGSMASRYKPADVRLTGITSSRASSQFGAHKVTGTVTNHSTFPAKNVQVVVGLYDAGGKIVGARRAVVPGASIAPGANKRFSVQIFNVAGKPAKSLTQVYGYDR